MSKKVSEAKIDGITYPLYSSKFTTKPCALHINDNLTAKMAGIPCISTSCHCNATCQARAKVTGSICEKCFAMKCEERYTRLEANNGYNFELLNARVLPLELLPTFGNVSIVRIEAFGDIASAIQAINYINIASINPNVTFGWWTKNPHFIEEAVKAGYTIPKNLIIIASSMFVNVPGDFSKYGFIDKVFTVYTPDYIEANNININCGARSCATCRRCYSKRTGRVVSEKLK